MSGLKTIDIQLFTCYLSSHMSEAGKIREDRIFLYLLNDRASILQFQMIDTNIKQKPYELLLHIRIRGTLIY